MIEFVCEGCGVEVIGYGIDEVPADRFCWLCKTANAYSNGDIMARRRRMEPGGWHSERERRRAGWLARAGVA